MQRDPHSGRACEAGATWLSVQPCKKRVWSTSRKGAPTAHAGGEASLCAAPGGLLRSYAGLRLVRTPCPLQRRLPRRRGAQSPGLGGRHTRRALRRPGAPLRAVGDVVTQAARCVSHSCAVSPGPA